MENHKKKSVKSPGHIFGQNQALNGKSLMAKTTNIHVPPSLTQHPHPHLRHSINVNVIHNSSDIYSNHSLQIWDQGILPQSHFLLHFAPFAIGM